MALGFLIHLFVAGALSIDPRYAKNLTLYHVNPFPYGPKPINMDTGDPAGDLRFDLMEVLITPLACQQGQPQGFSCDNPEANSKDLVLNKVVLEVDTRFSEYARCNIGRHGTDGFDHPCKDDTYCCFCSGKHYNETVPCNATLGRRNTSSLYSALEPAYTHSRQMLQHHHWGCHEDSPTWECYIFSVSKKFDPATNPGIWYSSLKKGYCGDGSNGEGECTWRVIDVPKVINKTCHVNTWTKAVEKKNTKCFHACAQPTNTSSPCWTTCFYETVLGPGGGVPGGVVTPTTGMDVDDVIAAWLSPFHSDDPAQGGCPNLL